MEVTKSDKNKHFLLIVCSSIRDNSGAILGVVVWALWALDGKITPTGCGNVSIIKKNMADVCMCGCMTSL